MNRTYKIITGIALSGFLIAAFSGNWGENTDLWEPVRNGSQFTADSLWLGATFIRDASKPFEVWLTFNEAGCKGALYFMVPNYPDSAFFLFYNKGNSGSTKIDLSQFNVPHLDTIFFMYRVFEGSCDKENRYTGPNRKAGDGWNGTDRYASSVKADYTLKGQDYPAHRRWCVAGWVRDNGMRTDTVEFGFEDLVKGDDDFDDIVFHVHGVYLIAPPNNLRIYSKPGTPGTNEKYPITSLSDLPAGEPINLYAHVFDTLGNWEQKYDANVEWRVIDVNGNQIHGPETGSQFSYTPKESDGTVTVIARFKNPDYPDAPPTETSVTLQTKKVEIPKVPSKLVSGITRDTDGNGYLDQIDIVFDSTVTLTNTDIAKLTIKYQSTTFSITQIVGGNENSGKNFSLMLTETKTDFQTGWKPSISISNIDGIAPVNEMELQDGAGPVIGKVTVHPAKQGTGTNVRDTLYINFSESVTLPASPQPNSIFNYYRNKSNQSGVFESMTFNNGTAIVIVSPNFQIENDEDSVQLSSNSNVKDNASIAPPKNGRKAVLSYEFEKNIDVATGPNPFNPTKTEIPDKATIYYKNVLQHQDNVREVITSNGKKTGLIIGVDSPAPLKLLPGNIYGEAKVYDAVGNVVKSELPLIKTDERSAYGIYWNGKNKNGRFVGNGTYLFIITFTSREGKTVTRKTKVGVLR